MPAEVVAAIGNDDLGTIDQWLLDGGTKMLEATAQAQISVGDDVQAKFHGASETRVLRLLPAARSVAFSHAEPLTRRWLGVVQREYHRRQRRRHI